MFSCRERLAALAAVLLACAGAQAAGPAAADAAPLARYVGIGRAATDREIAAWNIDVRPDLQGLPKGSGSVARGQEVWEAKCAACHGYFGESREFFSPIVGGTTQDDIRTGRVARLTDAAYPERTTMMKLATVSTLWDFIRRAMPWTAPKSLATDEVYAVVAYILNLAGVLPDNDTLSDANLAEVQGRMPNRHGMTTRHGLWPGKELGGTAKPDVQGLACMSRCGAEPKVASFLPDYARNQSGNLAEQNRLVGAQHGVDTTRPSPSSPAGARDAVVAAAGASARPGPLGNAADAAALALARQHNCLACHAVDKKVVGPAFRDVARKYADLADVASYLAGKIRSGGQGLWGPIPMPPQTLGDDDLRALAQWLSRGAPQ